MRIQMQKIITKPNTKEESIRITTEKDEITHPHDDDHDPYKRLPECKEGSHAQAKVLFSMDVILVGFLFLQVIYLTINSVVHKWFLT